MKRLVFTLVCFCLMAGAFAQSTQTGAQKKFQDEVLAFIKEEGYVPNINSNGVIEFKKEGEVHWISISKEAPFFVFFQRQGYPVGGDTGVDIPFALIACNEANRKLKAAKLYCTDKNVVFTVEQYIRSSEDFKWVFYKSLEKLKEAENSFLETYNNNRN